jgi:uncharacterized protein (DUF362 family)
MKKPIVYIDQLAATNDKLYLQFKDAAELIGLSDDIKSAKTIFIKPNLTYPTYKKGVTTRVEFIRELVGTLKDLNSNIKIYIGEGDGGCNSFAMDDVFKNMGFFNLEKEFSQVEVINLSKIPSKKVAIQTLRGPYELNLPEIFFKEIDFSISCPLPKIHGMTRVTLSYKNQWGCIPDMMRLKNHYMFDYIISKIADILNFKYAVLDGKYGLNNNGPMSGDVVEVNWFVAANSLGAFDSIISEMMGFAWRKIRHLRIAEKYGYLPRRDDIELIGDIESLRFKFSLRRGFWHYPALMAFKSKYLTKFFYLSRYSKIMHDIMYCFRGEYIKD